MTVPHKQVKGHINDTLNVAIERVKSRSQELFSAEIASTGNGLSSPFHKILMPEAKIFTSYERSLSASLGKAFDYIAAAIAKATYGNGRHDYRFSGTIPAECLAGIERIVASYRERPPTPPNTPKELKQLFETRRKARSDTFLSGTEKCDVFFVDHEGYKNYLEIKTAMPNYDQCAAVKTRILKIHCMQDVGEVKTRALAVFPHSPNGLIGNYSWPPLKYFLDPKHDWFARGQALMGPGLWNFVGNDTRTYDELLECFYEVSMQRRSDLRTLLNLSETVDDAD